MGRGVPLTDDDRWEWLQAVTESAQKRAHATGVAVGTCSALKRVYRDFLRKGAATAGVRVVFVFLYASEETLERRCGERKGHYMGAGMVRSQLAIMEVPGPEEELEPGTSSTAVLSLPKTPRDCVLVGEQEQAWTQQGLVDFVVSRIMSTSKSE